jgi:Uma2 family endonuclease
MSAIPKTHFTESEYLALERAADYRSEYYRGEIFAMAGASNEHNLIVNNLNFHLFTHLRGRGCRMYTFEMRLRINATRLYTYPDAMIVCGKSLYADDYVDTIVNPLIIVEVLSDSTESYDKGKKFDHYRQVPTVQEYILISQEIRQIERRVRVSASEWRLQVYDGLESVLPLDAIETSITLAQVYLDIEFPNG